MNAEDFTERYDRYLEAVNEPDAERRAGLLAASCTDDLAVVSPAYEVAGRARVADKLGELMASIDPPVRMRRAGAPDGHHSVFRVRWEAATDDGNVVVRGQHFVDTERDRLCRVAVFVETTNNTDKEER